MGIGNKAGIVILTGEFNGHSLPLMGIGNLPGPTTYPSPLARTSSLPLMGIGNLETP